MIPLVDAISCLTPKAETHMFRYSHAIAYNQGFRDAKQEAIVIIHDHPKFVHIVIGVDAHGSDIVKVFEHESDAKEFVGDIANEDLSEYTWVQTTKMKVN